MVDSYLDVTEAVLIKTYAEFERRKFDFRAVTPEYYIEKILNAAAPSGRASAAVDESLFAERDRRKDWRSPFRIPFDWYVTRTLWSTLPYLGTFTTPTTPQKVLR